MPRRKALVRANFSRSALERLRAHVDVVYKPWGETRRVLAKRSWWRSCARRERTSSSWSWST